MSFFNFPIHPSGKPDALIASLSPCPVCVPGVKFDRYAGMLSEEIDLNSVAFYRDAPLELKVDESAFPL